MNGLQFLAEALKRAPTALTMLITAHHDFDMAVAGFRLGLYRLIPKPWNREALIGALSQGAEKLHLRRENDRLTHVVADQVRELEALNAGLDAKLQHRTEQVIGALVTCLDYRDEETMSHSRRVSQYSKLMASHMGITGRELIDIEWGAMLHDIGKIGVPDSILLKPGRLTEDEWVIMRRHVNIGAHMINRIDFLRGAAGVVGDHHERFDGSGYPNRKRAEDIYVGARIFAVADTFDAITSDRPYRKARPDEEAAAEVKRVSGSQLDPECVEAFLAIGPPAWTSVRAEAEDWVADRAAPEEAESLTHGPGLEALRAAVG
jgi:putative nucleotidyltransferase with HDIG domain